MNPSNQTRGILFLLLAMVIGALAGAGTLGFLALIELGQQVFWPGDPRHFLDQVMASPWWVKLLIPMGSGA